MSKKNKSKPVEKIRLSGRNIYTDKKGRTIYYDFVTRQGYLIEKKSENSAQFYKNRLVVILFAAILFAGTFLTWIQAIIAWAVMMAVAEVMFRRSFLKKLEKVTDVDFEKRVSALQYTMENKEKGRIILLAVLYFALAVLVVLNAYMEKYSLELLILSGGIALVGINFSILHVVALIKLNLDKEKNQPAKPGISQSSRTKRKKS